jgi:hypothetical protein
MSYADLLKSLQRRSDKMRLFERTLNQIIERLGVKKGPPFPRDVDVFDKLLRFAASGLASAVGSRKRRRRVAIDIRRGRIFEIRTDSASREK